MSTRTQNDKFPSIKRLVVELIPDPGLGGYTARVPDIPAYGEGKTEEEAIADFKLALAVYVEAFGIHEATTRLNPPSSPTGSEMVRYLESRGFSRVRIRGSHHVMARRELRTTVPAHGSRTLKIGTLRGIPSDIDVSAREFTRLWKR